MAIALVTNTGAASSDNYNVTTSSVNTTGANLIVLATASYAPRAAPTVSDSKSNTWTALSTYTAYLSRVKLFYCLNPTVGSGHTFTATTSGSAPSICMGSFSGVKTSSAYEAENGNNVAPGTSLSTGSITPAENGELIMSALAISNSETPTVNSSLSILDHVAYATNHYGLDLAYLVQNSAAAINPTWSWTNSRYAAAQIACFKAAPSGFYGRPYYELIGRGGLNV